MSSKNKFAGKVAFVTGGAKGIGMAYVLTFIKYGVKVAFCDTDKTAGAFLINKLRKMSVRGVFFCCSVQDLKEMKRCLERTRQRYGKIDYFLNNAAIITGVDKWKTQMNLNMTAVISMTYMALEFMNPGGYIIATTSQAALYSIPLHPLYIAGKAAINCFVRSFGSYEIRQMTKVNVIAIAPGPTDNCHPLNKQSYRNKCAIPEEYMVLNYLNSNSISMEPQRSDTVAESLILLLENDVPSGTIWTVYQNIGQVVFNANVV